MSNVPKNRVTRILRQVEESGEDPEASADELVPLVYDELRRLAAAYLAHERHGHTLQPTALVHEAFVRLVDRSQVDWRGRTHFFAVCASTMRRVLVDSGRAHRSQKRGADWQRVTLDDRAPARELDVEELLSLDAALDRLATIDHRQARIVELRFFAGLDIDEVSAVVGVGRRTVERDWTHARAWLRRELAGGGAA